MSAGTDDKKNRGGFRSGVRSVMARLHGGELTARRLGLSVGLGLFIGSSPFLGLHTVLAGALAFVFRLDVLITYLASNISLPPLIPILLFAELQVGSLLLEGRFFDLGLKDLEPQKALELGAFVFAGFPFVALSIGFVGGALAYLIGRRIERSTKSGAPQASHVE